MAQAGKQVAKGSEVTVEVSKGNMAKVQNVVGKTEDQATAILEAQGFRVNPVEGKTVPADQAGQVESQDPEAGTPLVKGKTVTIAVTQPEPEQSESPTPTPTDTGPPTPTPPL